MKIALVGPPGAGKTTLFSLLTGMEYDKAIQQSGKIVPASVPVQDARLDLVAEHEGPTKKTTYATMTIMDTPDLVLESSGKTRNGEVLAQLRDADGLMVVLPGHMAPGDIGAIKAAAGKLFSELLFSDFQIAEKRIEKLKEQVQRAIPNRDELNAERELLESLLGDIESGNGAAFDVLNDVQEKQIRGFRFFSQKPVIWIANISEMDLDRADEIQEALSEYTGTVFVTSVKLELDLGELPEDERASFMEDYGVTEMATAALPRTAYDALGLQSFFTYGPDEMRAWTIRRGDSAVIAGGKIHSDIQRGFIAAEVAGYDDWMANGHDIKAVKAAGQLRNEGKEYVVADGDMIVFKFNV
jgi:ribosome-binding ATPase YchF (GTP1/OBG family)